MSLTTRVTPASVLQRVGYWEPAADSDLRDEVADSNDSTGAINAYAVKAADAYLSFLMSAPTVTAAGRIAATITNASRSGLTATLTTSAAHGMTAGCRIHVDCSNAAYSGTWTLTGVTSTTLTFTLASETGTSGAATGTVLQYGETLYGVSGVDRVSDLLGIGDPSAQGRIAVGYSDVSGGTGLSWHPAWTWTGVPSVVSADKSGPIMTTTPTGAAWSSADLSRIAVRITEPANGTTYEGVAGWQHSRVAARLHYAPIPRVHSITPDATVTTTARPQVTAVVDDAETNIGIDRVEVKVFAEPAGGWGGFVFAAETPVQEAVKAYGGGAFTSSVAVGRVSVSLPDDLENATEYRFYVRVRQRVTGVFSPWEYSQQSVDLETAVIAATAGSWSSAGQESVFTVRCAANMLTHEYETLSGTFTPFITGDLAYVDMTPSAVPAEAASAPFPVLPGESYGVKAELASQFGNRSIVVGCDFLDAAGAVLAGTTPTDTATTTASGGLVATDEATFTAVAPAGAATMRITFTFSAVDTYRIHRAYVAPHPAEVTAAWSFPNGAATGSLLVEASDDGGPWRVVAGVANTSGYTTALPTEQTALGQAGLRVDPASQEVIVRDAEAVRGVTVAYRARFQQIVEGGLAQGSPVAVSVATVSDGEWWLKCPDDPSLNVGGVRVQRRYSTSVSEALEVYEPLNRDQHVVITSGFLAQTGDFTVVAVGDSEWETVSAVLYAPNVLLLQGPFGVHQRLRVTGRDVSWDGSSELPVRSVGVDWVAV